VTSRRGARPFTAVLCRAGGCGGDDGIAGRLRATVRSCPHAVLVVSPCPLGAVTCRSLRGPAGRGAFVLVQPCDESRRPTGALITVGPLADQEDGLALCDWLAVGRLDPDLLPDRLVPLRARLRDVAAN
jgi:hypothetical protein